MILNERDPLVKVLRDMGEPIYVMDTNPTAETLARLLYEVAAQQGFPVSRVRFWESPTSRADYVPSSPRPPVAAANGATQRRTV
jgi:6-pyruvoyltetrahydropterin/6-carboxytetrahydropterin synthase